MIRMRVLMVLVAALALASPAARAQSAGAYETLSAADAAACAHRCAGDGLCMSWLYRADGACELRAIGLPSDAPSASGYSSRAPSFLRARADAPMIRRPLEAIEDAEPTAEPLPVMDDEMTASLLGGPDETRSGIRPRLRN